MAKVKMGPVGPAFAKTWNPGWKPVMVIIFYSSNCLDQKTAMGPFGVRVKLPPAHQPNTHGRGFKLPLFIAEHQDEGKLM